jgi:hypothetical protein
VTLDIKMGVRDNIVKGILAAVILGHNVVKRISCLETRCHVVLVYASGSQGSVWPNSFRKEYIQQSDTIDL